jgi:hypothetical protein
MMPFDPDMRRDLYLHVHVVTFRQVFAYTDALDEAMLRKERTTLDAYCQRAAILERKIAARVAAVALLGLGVV